MADRPIKRCTVVQDEHGLAELAYLQRLYVHAFGRLPSLSAMVRRAISAHTEALSRQVAESRWHRRNGFAPSDAAAEKAALKKAAALNDHVRAPERRITDAKGNLLTFNEWIALK